MRVLALTIWLLLISFIAFGQKPNRSARGFTSTAIPTQVLFAQMGIKLDKQIPSLGSLIIYQQNHIIYEHYFHGADSLTSFNVKSITKSVVSTLAGLAKDRKLLPDLNTPVLTVLSEYATPPSSVPNRWFATQKSVNDSINATVTLKDLLTMQAGYLWSDFGPMANALLFCSDPVRFTLDLPFEESPGKVFNYNTGAAIVFGTALAKCIKTDLKTFADSTLFNPLGIQVQRWDTDPLGRYLGGSELFMTPKELMRYGLLYLRNGRVGSKQVLSASWINESIAQHAELKSWPVMPGADGYGYYWWRRKIHGCQAFVASGYGGQLVCVIPKKGILVVTTCFINEKNRGREEIKRLHLIIDQVVNALN